MTFSLDKINRLKELVAGADRMVISTHKSPDGDAIGSSLALAGILRKLGKHATVVVPDAIPAFLHWMDGAADILIYENTPEAVEAAITDAQLIWCLDYNDLSRVEKIGHFIHHASAPSVLVDHHQHPADFAEVMFSDVTMNSTALMIHDLAVAAGWSYHIGTHEAAALYCGIMTDTGSFKYSGTTPHTHRVVANLLELGIDHTEIHRQVFDTNSAGRLRLMGYALSEKMVVLPEYHAAYIWLTDAELKAHHYQKGDTEGLVNMALSLQEVELAAFFAEKDGKVKISFRSKGSLPVNTMARDHFMGGGHINAAGGIYDAGMDDAIALFRSLLPQWVTL
jgi:phosphoesterase RecJ-like protein